MTSKSESAAEQIETEAPMLEDPREELRTLDEKIDFRSRELDRSVGMIARSARIIVDLRRELLARLEPKCFGGSVPEEVFKTYLLAAVGDLRRELSTLTCFSTAGDTLRTMMDLKDCADRLRQYADSHPEIRESKKVRVLASSDTRTTSAFEGLRWTKEAPIPSLVDADPFQFAANAMFLWGKVSQLCDLAVLQPVFLSSASSTELVALAAARNVPSEESIEQIIAAGAACATFLRDFPFILKRALDVQL